MRLMFGPFGMDPFALAPQIQPPRAPRRQVTVRHVGGLLIYAFCVFHVFDIHFSLSVVFVKFFFLF